MHIEIIGHINPRRRTNCLGTHYYMHGVICSRTYHSGVNCPGGDRDMQFTPDEDSLLPSNVSFVTVPKLINHFAVSDTHRRHRVISPPYWCSFTIEKYGLGLYLCVK